MKNLWMACAVMLVACALQAQQPLNVMTFNVRYNTPRDSANAWPFRKDFAAGQILFHDTHLFGVQEALHDQMMDLLQAMPRYKTFGGGRDDGKEKGEYSAVFWDTTRLQWLKGAMFWLSQTPEVVASKGWDAAITRMVTWCYFKDKKSGKKFYFFNTHFDHMGKVARAESAKLLLRKVAEIAGAAPVIITGDFNAQPQDEPIRILTDSSNQNHFIDTKGISQTPHYGPSGTFNGFGSKENSDQPIDYIFMRNGIKVLKHATLSQSWQGRFSSDHFPVFAVLQLP